MVKGTHRVQEQERKNCKSFKYRWRIQLLYHSVMRQLLFLVDDANKSGQYQTSRIFSLFSHTILNNQSIFYSTWRPSIFVIWKKSYVDWYVRLNCSSSAEILSNICYNNVNYWLWTFLSNMFVRLFPL